MKFLPRFTQWMVILVLALAVFSASQAFAMPQLIAFLKSSPAAADLTCPPVSNTFKFTSVYGTVLLDGANAPMGAMVQAFSPRGDQVGCAIVSTAGLYGVMFIYGEDNSTTPPIPGMRSGETVTFTVNGGLAQTTPPLIWYPDINVNHQVALSAATPMSTPTGTATPAMMPHRWP